MNIEKIYREINRERGHTTSRTAAQSGGTRGVADFILMMELHLEKAKSSLQTMNIVLNMRDEQTQKRLVMENIRSLSAHAIGALENHGCPTVNSHPVLPLVCRECKQEILVPEGIELISCYNCGAPQQRQSHA